MPFYLLSIHDLTGEFCMPRTAVPLGQSPESKMIPVNKLQNTNTGILQLFRFYLYEIFTHSTHGYNNIGKGYQNKTSRHFSL